MTDNLSYTKYYVVLNIDVFKKRLNIIFLNTKTIFNQNI